MGDVMGYPAGHSRRSIRLKGYDYSREGAYFVTICAQERACLFGEIVDGQMRENAAGFMIRKLWDSLPERFPDLELDAFVVMPNHIHGILVLTENRVGAPLVGAHGDSDADHDHDDQRVPTRGAPTLGSVVGAYKSLTTLEYIKGVNHHGWPPFAGRVWQRNYYEHIIRDEISLHQIRDYIASNLMNWDDDLENPAVKRR